MSIDRATALAAVGLDVERVAFSHVEHNQMLTAGVWQISESGRRMILKCLTSDREAPGSSWDAHWSADLDRPARWNYWAREALAYRFGVTASFEPHLTPPKILAEYHDERAIVLLLEFVDGVPAERWGADGYARAAHALGRAQGAQLVGKAIPAFGWLSRRFLREYSSEKPVDWSLLDSNAAWAQPLIRDTFPIELRSEAVWLHSVRDRLYAIIEALPRVLCHLDFWTKNLITRDDGSIALLDWAFVGDGAIGEDVGNMVPDAAFDHFVPAEALPDLHAAVLDAYTEGLIDAGWDGDSRIVEIGMCASAIKYDWLTPHMLRSAAATRHLRYGANEEIDPQYRFRERGIALLHNARTARRAIALADHLHQ